MRNRNPTAGGELLVLWVWTPGRRRPRLYGPYTSTASAEADARELALYLEHSIRKVRRAPWGAIRTERSREPTPPAPGLGTVLRVLLLLLPAALLGIAFPPLGLVMIGFVGLFVLLGLVCAAVLGIDRLQRGGPRRER